MSDVQKESSPPTGRTANTSCSVSSATVVCAEFLGFMGSPLLVTSSKQL